jgi:hypothetical protein
MKIADIAVVSSVVCLEPRCGHNGSARSVHSPCRHCLCNAAYADREPYRTPAQKQFDTDPRMVYA